MTKRYISQSIRQFCCSDGKRPAINSMKITEIQFCVSHENRLHGSCHIPKGWSVKVTVLKDSRYRRTVVDNGPNIQTAIAALGRHVDERQSEADAPGSPGGDKRIAHTANRFRIHTPAIVGNANGNRVIGTAFRNMQPHLARFCFQRVLYQVENMESQFPHAARRIWR